MRIIQIKEIIREGFGLKSNVNDRHIGKIRTCASKVGAKKRTFGLTKMKKGDKRYSAFTK
jgi:hypothetical protein